MIWYSSSFILTSQSSSTPSQNGQLGHRGSSYDDHTDSGQGSSLDRGDYDRGGGGGTFEMKVSREIHEYGGGILNLRLRQAIDGSPTTSPARASSSTSEFTSGKIKIDG